MTERARHTINVRKSTKNRLKEFGKIYETYDDLITRLLDHWDKTHNETKKSVED